MKYSRIIAIDARFMLRPLRGMPLYVYRLCQNLPALNKYYQFIYFINKGFEHNDRPENYLPRIREIEEQNPNVTFVNFDDDAEIKWEQIILPRLLKQYKIDLLHMPGNRICFFPRVHTVVTVHDVMEYMYLWQMYKKSIPVDKNIKMLFYKTRMAAYALANYKFGFRRASKIITVSEYSAEDISSKLKISKSKVIHIHHGLDENFTCENITPLKKRSFTLMLGGDSYQKNPEMAISSWAKVEPSLRNKYPLKIVGFCGNKTSPLLQAIKENGLENEVEVNGWISQEEMVRKFREAALFLFPSRYEGFGFPLLQAMASGTPVVSTNRSSIPEVLGDIGLMYDPDDAIGMASGIEKILTNSDEWKKQSAAGYQRSTLFSWKSSAQKHLNLYEACL